jgi:hypothetical protein
MEKKNDDTNIPEIFFTNDWHEILRGNLIPGGEFKISYDTIRLPNRRMIYQGMPSWSILAYIKFKENGKIDYKTLTVGQEGIVTLLFDIPKDSEEVIIWFVNSDESGGADYDSNYGSNYHFPIIKR